MTVATLDKETVEEATEEAIELTEPTSGITAPEGWFYQELAAVPRPTQSYSHLGWKIGVIIRSDLLKQTYITHPEHGTWSHTLESPIAVAKPQRFQMGIDAINAIQETISLIPVDEIKEDPIDLELPIVNRLGIETEKQVSLSYESEMLVPFEQRAWQPMDIPRHLLDKDGDTQRRVQLNLKAIENYAEYLIGGGKLPALKVVLTQDGRLLLVDGNHSNEALGVVNADYAICIVKYGTLEEAQDFALSVNTEHGVPLQDPDKFSKVEWALQQERHQRLTNAELARLCSVSGTFVAKVKRQTGFIEQGGTKTVTRNGKQFEQKIQITRTIDDARKLYEPYGDFDRVFGTNNLYELRQRGKLIVNFSSPTEAYDGFESITQKIQKLSELPAGPDSCTLCVHRQDLTTTEWECGAKTFVLAHDVDWAEQNNGDCRLFKRIEQALITFDVDDYLERPVEAIKQEVIDPADYLKEEEVVVQEEFDRSAVLKSGAKNGNVDNNEQYTPPHLWEAALRVFGVKEFDLDAASHPGSPIPCKRMFTKDDSALGQNWKKTKKTKLRNVWFNFPFSLHKEMEAQFSEQRDLHGFEAIGLIKCDCRATWYQSFTLKCDAFCQIKGGLKFDRPEGEENNSSSFFGAVIVYYGNDVDAFYKEYNALGVVAIPIKPEALEIESEHVEEE